MSYPENSLRSGGLTPLQRCTWCILQASLGGGACGVMVIVVGNGHGDTSSKPWPRLIAFHIALIPLGKV